jgi:Cof subfamily protein (haloacid dehalogenase superfamily)
MSASRIPPEPPDAVGALGETPVPPSLDLRHIGPGFRVVAIDLDGTILDEDLEVRQFTRRVFRALRAGGLRIIVTTGRMFATTVPYAGVLQGDGPVVCHQGALVRDLETGETLYHDPLSPGLARDVLAVLAADACTPNVYMDDTVYVPLGSHQPDLIRRVEKSGALYHPVRDPAAQVGAEGPTKIMATGAPGDLDRIGRALRARHGTRLFVRKSLPGFLEIAAGTVSKARALAFVAERYGFSPAHVVAFGDGHNDTDLLAWAGLGVAPQNAPADVRAAADLVCGPVTSQGVARFLLGLPVSQNGGDMPHRL